MLRKTSLIVFDIDGTLTDSVKLHQAAFKQTLRLIGIDTFDDQFGGYTHHTDTHIARVIYETATGKPFDNAIAEQFENHLYDLLRENDIKEIEGAGKFITDLETQTAFGVCFATGSLCRPARLKLEHTGIAFHPLQLVASNNIEAREEIIKRAIANAQQHCQVAQFDRILSFGDGLWDLKAADNLALEFIGIGRTNEQVLRAAGMKRYFNDFKELTIGYL